MFLITHTFICTYQMGNMPRIPLPWACVIKPYTALTFMKLQLEHINNLKLNQQLTKFAAFTSQQY
jgi:hypothetical protein